MSDERWLTVPSYEGAYEVSSVGRVRSLARLDGQNRRVPAAIKKSRLNHDGYPVVTLSKDSRSQKCFVHMLVLAAFVGPRPDGLVTRHLNGDSEDNRIENLTYGTQADNLRDRVRHGTDPNASRTHCKNNHPFDGSNVTRRAGRRGRVCRICERERTRSYKARKAATQRAMAS